MPSLLRTTALALLLTTTGAQAQDMYGGWEFRGASTNSRWVDPWGYNGGNGYAGQPNVHGPDAGYVLWQGQGSHSSSRPVENFVSAPVTLSFQSDAAGSFVGDTYSGGAMSLPGATAFPGVAQARFHLYSVLADNLIAFTATSAMIAGNFHTDASDSPYAPLHYRIDWRVQASGDANLAASLMIARGEETYTLAPGSGSIVGVLGPEYYAYPGSGLRRPFDLNTYAGDSSGAQGSGRVDLWATLSLSSSPIPAVPEPGTWALMAAGLLAVGRRARRPRCGR